MRRLSPMIIVLLLAACGGGEAETATTTAPEPSTTAAETTTTTAAPTTTTTEATTTTTTTTAPEPNAEECLVGTWDLDSESFVDSLMATMGTDLPGEITSGGGSYVVEMGADGSFEVTRDEWRYLIESPQGTLVAQIDGTETGTYEADGDTLTATTTGGDATVSMGLLVDGELQDLPFPMEMDLATDAIAGSAQYECTEETLTVSSEAEGPGGGTLEFQSVLLRR